MVAILIPFILLGGLSGLVLGPFVIVTMFGALAFVGSLLSPLAPRTAKQELLAFQLEEARQRRGEL
jgi:hypothetical protein